jgi:hypothetical protein
VSERGHLWKLRNACSKAHVAQVFVKITMLRSLFRVAIVVNSRLFHSVNVDTFGCEFVTLPVPAAVLSEAKDFDRMDAGTVGSNPA